MTDQPIAAKPKAVRKPQHKVAKAYLNPDIRLGTQDAQIEMDNFLRKLTLNERTTLEKFLAVWKPGTPCFNNGYRKMIRYTKAWLQNNGKPVNLD